MPSSSATLRRPPARHPLLSAFGALFWATLIVGGVLGAARVFGAEASAAHLGAEAPAAGPGVEAY